LNLSKKEAVIKEADKGNLEEVLKLLKVASSDITPDERVSIHFRALLKKMDRLAETYHIFRVSYEWNALEKVFNKIIEAYHQFENFIDIVPQQDVLLYQDLFDRIKMQISANVFKDYISRCKNPSPVYIVGKKGPKGVKPWLN